MDEIKKVIKEMKREKSLASACGDWGVKNTLERFIRNLEDVVEVGGNDKENYQKDEV